MQSIQYRLQARQDRAIQFDGERALQTRFMLRLLEQVLQFDKLDLQVQLPTLKTSAGPRKKIKKNKKVDRHCHELLDGLIRAPRKKQRRLFVGIIVIRRTDLFYRTIGRKRVGRDEARVQPADVQTEATCAALSSVPHTISTALRCLLSKLLAEFPARLRGPPKSRDEAGPYDADGDGR